MARQNAICRPWNHADTEEAIWNDLRTIESEMRNQYRVVNNPANLKHDGGLKQLALRCEFAARLMPSAIRLFNSISCFFHFRYRNVPTTGTN